MTFDSRNRSTAEKLAIFRRCFRGLKHVYGTYDPRSGRARQVKQPVTDRVLLRHLQGNQPYGVYLLVEDRTTAVVADFDEEDTWLPLQFVRQARHYRTPAYLERSKSKGWHVWIFLAMPGVLAAKARLVAMCILADIGATAVEVFPKQNALDGDRRYGNFIYAPLFGALVPQGRTVFVDPKKGLRPIPDQWSFLEGIERVGESLLDDIIEINQLGAENPDGTQSESTEEIGRSTISFGLLPCARRMLAEGVTAYQRVACFRLAVHLRRLGIPQDLTLAVLRAWAGKNRPREGRRIITPNEIATQTQCAYAKTYRGFGCEEPAFAPFCRSDCPIHAKGRQPSQQADAGRFAPWTPPVH